MPYYAINRPVIYEAGIIIPALQAVALPECREVEFKEDEVWRNATNSVSIVFDVLFLCFLHNQSNSFLQWIF